MLPYSVEGWPVNLAVCFELPECVLDCGIEGSALWGAEIGKSNRSMAAESSNTSFPFKL